MLDAPCGDLTWMHLVRGIENVRYTGADISSSAVRDNQRKFPGGGGLGESGGGGVDSNEEVGGVGWRGGQGQGQVKERAGGFLGAVFVQADLVEGVPPSVDGEPYDIVFLRSVFCLFLLNSFLLPSRFLFFFFLLLAPQLYTRSEVTKNLFFLPLLTAVCAFILIARRLHAPFSPR